MSQTKFWSASKGSVTRVALDGSPKQGCGNSKRLYVGRQGDNRYASWLAFTMDWTYVGQVLKATLILYTDDFLGAFTEPTDIEFPEITVARLTAAFTEGNNADGTFDASDYFTAPVSTTGVKRPRMTKVADEPTRIDITDFANLWAPKTVKSSTGGVGQAAPNLGVRLWQSGQNVASNQWSGWSEDAVDAGLRPQIELVYEYGSTAPTSTNASPSGSVASIGSFTGVFSDIDSRDQLRKSEVEVYTAANAATAAAATDLVTDAAHGLKANDVIYFTSLTAGVGLTAFTPYYVIASGLTTGVFKVSATLGGAAVNITTNYSAMSWAKRVYSKRQNESNAAIVAAVFDHVPDNFHPLKNTSYRWRNRLTDQDGSESGWTSLTTFSVTNTDPGTPTLSPTSGRTYATLDGVQFRGTFTDADAGDTLLAYEVQLSAYPSGNANWDDDSFRLWGTGKRFVPTGATTFTTPYGGVDLTAGTYYWRARVWDVHNGVSSWAYATIILSASFDADPQTSVNAIQARPRVPWRIVIKEMKFNTTGGGITGVASTNLLTSTTAHGLRAGRRVRFSVLTGGTGLVKARDYYVIASGLTTTAFKVSETLGGAEVNFTTNVTATTTLTAVTTRGPGNVVAVLEDASNVGASMLYNSPGELHFTLGISHPQIAVIEPRQTHYSVQFRQGDGWREVFAGLMMDFDAGDTDVIFYGTDYLGLLDGCLDEHFIPSNIEADYTKGGGKYTAVTIRTVIIDQLKRAREVANSVVGFISTGTIATMDETITTYSYYQPTLNYVVGLIDSHRAGAGKRSRISVIRTAENTYAFTVVDDPGIVRDNLRLRYGELVQGYRVIPFGTQWASRVSAIGRDKNGVLVRYKTLEAPGIDETVWGRWTLPQFFDGTNDANDFERRTRQAAVQAGKLGKNLGLGLRSGVLQPRDGFDLCDYFPVDIEHGSVSTSAFGSGYWQCVGITWQALQRGDLNTTLTLLPREDTTAPSPDLLTLQDISTQAEWQVGWTAPEVVSPTSQYWFDNTSGKVYVRTGGVLKFTGITALA